MDASNLQEVLRDYENLVKELTNELKSVKSEHEELKSKIPAVVHENEDLLHQLKETSKKSKDSLDTYELVENLREQINLVLQEKEEIKKLWESAIRSVEILENELKIYKSGTSEFFPKQTFLEMKQTYEDKLSKACNQLELKQKSLEEKNREVERSNEIKESETKKVEKLMSQIEGLRNKIEELEDSNDKLRNSFYDKEKLIQDTMLQNSEYREKMNEAMQVVQAALNEKDGALLREATVRLDIEKLNEELDTILEEVKVKIDTNVTKINDANKKYDLLLDDCNKITKELKSKTSELEKYQAKSELLQKEIDKFLSGGINNEESQTSRLLSLEKNLEATFQKLLISEKQNIQIKSDHETLKNNMEQMGTYYEEMLKSKEVKNSSLQNAVNQLQSSLKERDLSNTSLTNEIQRLRNEVIAAGREHKKHIENQDTLLDEERSRFQEKRKELIAKVVSKEKINKKLVAGTKELYNMLESLIRTLKTEKSKLKRENLILKEQLAEYKARIIQYKEFINILNSDFSNIKTVDVLNLEQ